MKFSLLDPALLKRNAELNVYLKGNICTVLEQGLGFQYDNTCSETYPVYKKTVDRIFKKLKSTVVAPKIEVICKDET
jgi:hypothetical protein